MSRADGPSVAEPCTRIDEHIIVAASEEVGQGLPAESVEPVEASLEDVFLDVVEKAGRQ